MDESGFEALAAETLAAIEEALEHCGADIDYELQPGGVLEIVCADGSRIVINRHAATGEIWIAARAGGFHFRPEQGRWRGTRDGRELFEVLEQLVSEQSGTPVRLRR